MVDFAQLKANSGQKSIDALNAEISKFTQKQERGPDERFWSPTVDKAGNGSALIRFLSAPEGEDVPFVRYYDHGFQGPTGKWYIENSLTTFEGESDPVSDYNSKLWDTGLESNKDIVRKQKRRLHFVSNILVIDDSAKPECNGKVYLFKYGKKIFTKLSDATKPQFADEEAVNAFDMFAGGAPFKLKIRNVEGYRNYDKSEFGKVGPLSKDDDEIHSIWKQCYSLKEILDRKNFKTYAELQAKLVRVLNANTTVENTPAGRADVDDLPPWADAPANKERVTQAPKTPVVDDDDDEQGLDYFKKLAAS